MNLCHEKRLASALVFFRDMCRQGFDSAAAARSDARLQGRKAAHRSYQYSRSMSV